MSYNQPMKNLRLGTQKNKGNVGHYSYNSDGLVIIMLERSMNASKRLINIPVWWIKGSFS